MPIETIASTELVYHLIAFDAEARERNDDPDGRMTERTQEALTDGSVTDVFLMSHGWMGDIPAARKQYTAWIEAMAANEADLSRTLQARSGFRPLMIGLHWPSLPFGEEALGGSEVSFAAGAPTPGGDATVSATPMEQLVDEYAQTLADTPTSRQALKTIVQAAMEDIAPAKMPPHVIQAYEVLNRESALGSEGVGSAPGADREPFDPEATFRDAEQQAPSFGGVGLGGLLAPLRTMSFWKMKDRASKFGATAGHGLLKQLQQTSGPDVRFHLMGHSFGCIVMSATLAGTTEENQLVRPVDSVALVQGALSLWSYAPEIPHASGKPGFFHRIVSERRIAGPLITTQSEHDTAVGSLYPLAAGVAGQVVFAPGELPKYGALGTYGARGLGPDTEDMAMLSVEENYFFTPGKVYNLESSHVIREGGGLSGAHNDISRPEVAHAVWQAAFADLS